VDTQTIGERIEQAWHLPMGTVTREQIFDWLSELTGCLNPLKDESLDDRVETRRLLRVVHRHLSPDGWPDEDTPTWEALQFMKVTAVLARGLLGEYRRVHEQR
jgi:hypothetical protein